jgi:hypothetical protein
VIANINIPNLACSPPLMVLRGTTAVRGFKPAHASNERRALMRTDC